MSQEQLAQRRPYRSFEKRSDTTFWIILSVGVALVAGLALVDWASDASTANSAAKPAVSVQAKSTAEPVYRCADGRVSFKPCS